MIEDGRTVFGVLYAHLLFSMNSLRFGEKRPYNFSYSKFPAISSFVREGGRKFNFSGDPQ